MSATTEIQNAKELLKNITKLLQNKQTAALASHNPSLSAFIAHLQSITEALKDTYSPNILRFMTKRDAYIKELTASAKNVIEHTMPQTISAAENLTVNANDKAFLQSLLDYLTSFAQANSLKQDKINAGKGDMVENTTHDIMKKYVHKNFQDIADMFTLLNTALSDQL